MQHRTGHGRRTVREAIFVLQDEGWISRQPPPEDLSRREHVKTRTWLHLPGSKQMMAVRELLTGPDHHARRARARDRWQRWKKDHDGETPDWAADPALLQLAARTLAEFNHGRDPGPDVAAAAVTAVLGGHARGYFNAGPARYLTKSLRKDPRRFLPTARPAAAPPVPSADTKAAAQDATAAGAADARRRLAERPRPGAPP